MDTSEPRNWKQPVAGSLLLGQTLEPPQFACRQKRKQQQQRQHPKSIMIQVDETSSRNKQSNMKQQNSLEEYKRTRRKEDGFLRDFRNTAPPSRQLPGSVNVLLCLILTTKLLCDNPNSSSAIAEAAAEQPDTPTRQRFLEEPQDTIALLGQSADLACSIENASGQPFWERDGFKIQYLERYTMPHLQRQDRSSSSLSSISSATQEDFQQQTNIRVTNSSLHIEPVSLIDDAPFRCRAYGDSPNFRSRQAKFTVLKPPTQLTIKANSVEEDRSEGFDGGGSDVVGDSRANLASTLEILGPILDSMETHKQQQQLVNRAGQPIDSLANQPTDPQPLHRLMDGVAVDLAASNWTKLSSASLVVAGQSGAGSQDDEPLLQLMNDDDSTSAFDITRIIVKQNARLRLECSADQAKPHAELVWLDHRQQPVAKRNGDSDNNSSSSSSSSYVDDVEVRVDPKEDKLALATLVWSLKVQRHHQNQVFTCLAKHPAFGQPQLFPHLYGQEPRRRIRLDVHYKPDILSLTKEPSQAYENQSIVFQCQAQGRPNDLTYRWFIDNKLVENATQPELRIERLTRQMHLREIKCQVRNSVGTTSIEHKLHVRYSPAFITHLLPESLQPAQQDNDYLLLTSSSSRPSGAAPKQQPPSSNRQRQLDRLADLSELIVVARQLSRGYLNGQEVQLRCDFDSNPRIHQIQWYKITNENYSIMGNVTPAEADELMAWGETHAHFLRRAGAHTSDRDHDPESATMSNNNEPQRRRRRRRNIRGGYQTLNIRQHQPIDLDEVVLGVDGTSGSLEQQQQQLQVVQLDYHRMSEALLEELAYYEDQLKSSNLSSSQNFEKIPSQQPTQTTVPINEPLRWILKQPAAARLPPNHSVAQGNQLPVANRAHQLAAMAESTTTTTMISLSLIPASELSLDEPRVLLPKREAQVTSSYINLNKTNDESMGKYICLARSPDGSASFARSIYLVKRDQPRLISHPNQWAPLGSSNLQVDCLAQTSGVVDNVTSFTWYKDGKPILIRKEPTIGSAGATGTNDGTRSFRVEIQRSPDLLYMRSILHVDGAEFNDFGRYNCFVINSKGNDSMLINLQPSAPTGFVFAVMASLAIGSILLLVCILGLLLICAPRRKLDSKASLANNNLDSQSSDIEKSSPSSIDSHGDRETLSSNGGSVSGGQASIRRTANGLQQQQQHQENEEEDQCDNSESMQQQVDQQSRYRAPLRQQQQQQPNAGYHRSSSKFAAIHESLEHKLHLGQSLFAHHHRHHRQESMESNGADNKSTGGQPLEQVELDHHQKQQQQQQQQLDASIGKIANGGSRGQAEEGSLLHKLWARLLAGPSEGFVAAGSRRAKSRPTISIPVNITTSTTATNNTTTTSHGHGHQSSMRKSSQLSTSLSVLGGPDLVAAGAADAAASAANDNAKNIKSLNMKRTISNNNGGGGNLNLVSSSANLIQDSTTASDGSVNSGRSSSNSSGGGGGGNQINEQQLHKGDLIGAGPLNHQLQHQNNGIHVAYATSTGGGGYGYNHIAQQANINWQPVQGRNDSQSPVNFITNPLLTNPACVGPSMTDCSMYINDANYHRHMMDNSHVYSNSHLTTFHQDPSYPMTHVGYTSQPLGWSDHSQSAPINHYQHPTLPPPPPTANESYFPSKQQPFYATLCNNTNNKTAAHYGIVSTNNIINNNNNNYISMPHRPASTQCPPAGRVIPTSDAGDAFFDENYGTMLSRSKAYTKLGYATSSALSATHYIASAHSVSPTTSTSPSSSGSHSNTTTATTVAPNLNIDSITQQLQAAVTSGELPLTSKYINESHTTMVQSDGSTTTTNTTKATKNIDDNGLATHV